MNNSTWYIDDEKEEEICLHTSCLPKFDREATKGLSKYEVRKRWPRFDGECSDCHEQVILYDSWAHYVCGDW